MIGVDVRSDLRLPLISVAEQLLLVVQQLLVGLGRELKVGAFDDGIDWACFLRIEFKSMKVIQR